MARLKFRNTESNAFLIYFNWRYFIMFMVKGILKYWQTDLTNLTTNLHDYLVRASAPDAQVAQSVEQWTENHRSID